jgi:hypothetical protein
MDSIYIIARNTHGNPKDPLRCGARCVGAQDLCLYSENILCFPSFEAANKALVTLAEPHWYDIIEYRKHELINDERSYVE